MVFKEAYLMTEVFYLKPKARSLLVDVDWTSLKLFKKPIMVTEVWYEGRTGVHGDFRAFDVRSKGYYTKEEETLFADTVNRKWIYDPKRPEMKTCVVEDDCLHFQVALE